MKTLKCTYDKNANAFYIYLTKKVPHFRYQDGFSTHRLPPPILFALDKNQKGKTIGIEIVLGDIQL